MARDRTVRALLERYGETFAEEAGVDVRDTPSALFGVLTLAILGGSPVRADVSVRAARALRERGWKTPEAMARATKRGVTAALRDAGYARFVEQAAIALGRAARETRDRYGGDLRRLRREAGGDPARVRALLQAFPGIGPVGAGIFCREVQGLWDELHPCADERALRAAARLGLGRDARALARLVPRKDLPRLVSALVRAERAA